MALCSFIIRLFGDSKRVFTALAAWNSLNIKGISSPAGIRSPGTNYIYGETAGPETGSSQAQHGLNITPSLDIVDMLHISPPLDTLTSPASLFLPCR